mgnify:CR=1 FL=1
MKRKTESQSETSVSQCLLFQPLSGRQNERELRKVNTKFCGNLCRNNFKTSDCKARTKIQNRRNIQFLTDCTQARSG